MDSIWCAGHAAKERASRPETMTPYLSLDSSDENGFLVKMVPPIRAKEHGDALWGGLTEGTINTLGTDNTSRTRGTKQPGAGLHGARPGYPVLGTHLPSMLHYAGCGASRSKC